MAGDLASLITGTKGEREEPKEERSSGRKSETDLDGWSPGRQNCRLYPQTVSVVMWAWDSSIDWAVV